MKLLFCALLSCVLVATARAGEVTFTLSDLLGKGPITQITLQHSHCYGPCTTDATTLNADGSAQFVGRRPTARQGLYRGQIALAKYNELADFLRESSFFELRAEVGEQLTSHPNDTIVSVRRGSSNTAVVFHYGHDSALLARLEAAFASASAQVNWVKDESASASGAQGTVTRDLTPYEIRLFARHQPDLSRLPMEFALVTLTSRDDTTLTYSIHTDANGHFQIFAPPGRYYVSVWDESIEPHHFKSYPYLPHWATESFPIEVVAQQFVKAEAQMRDINSDTKPQSAIAPARVSP